MNPRVTCICLTADRQAQTDRAVRSFLAQTYEEKHLLILDTGREAYEMTGDAWDCRSIISLVTLGPRTCTIGKLRNLANELASGDIIAHWDSDDVSAPTRLAEQVAHLQASGAEVVGFSDMLFWASERGGLIFDEANANRPGKHWPEDVHRPAGEAWLFNNHKPNYGLGTSLCYWRKTWERKPFPEHTNPGCDDRLWVEGLKVATITSVAKFTSDPRDERVVRELQMDSPMMVAEIHGGNTCARITEPSTDWQRVPAWDTRLAEIMRLDA